MLAERLKTLRQGQHLSQMALSKIIGVSQQTIGSWETGRTSPDKDMITTLAKHFNVTTDYLLGNSPTTHSITNNGTMNGNIINGDVNGGSITTTTNIHHGISDSHYAKVFEAIFKDYPEAYAVLDQVKVTDDGDLKNVDQCDEKYIRKMAKALMEALQEAHDNKKNSVEIEV